MKWAAFSFSKTPRFSNAQNQVVRERGAGNYGKKENS